MSYFREKHKGNRDDKPAASLASKMYQGDQPKHASGTALSPTMRQAGAYPGDKGTCCMALGGVMGQGGSKRHGG